MCLVFLTMPAPLSSAYYYALHSAKRLLIAKALFADHALSALLTNENGPIFQEIHIRDESPNEEYWQQEDRLTSLQMQLLL